MVICDGLGLIKELCSATAACCLNENMCPLEIQKALKYGCSVVSALPIYFFF